MRSEVEKNRRICKKGDMDRKELKKKGGKVGNRHGELYDIK